MVKKCCSNYTCFQVEELKYECPHCHNKFCDENCAQLYVCKICKEIHCLYCDGGNYKTKQLDGTHVCKQCKLKRSEWRI